MKTQKGSESIEPNTNGSVLSSAGDDGELENIEVDCQVLFLLVLVRVLAYMG